MSERKSSTGESIALTIGILLFFGWLAGKGEHDRTSTVATPTTAAPKSVERVEAPSRSCPLARREIERYVWIEAAVRLGDCPTFASYGAVGPQNSPRDATIKRISGPQEERVRPLDQYCGDEIERTFEEVAAWSGSAYAFCRRARHLRDYGIGFPGRPTAADLVAKLKTSLQEGESILGIWVDDLSPAGSIAITKVGPNLFEHRYFSDGSGARGDVLEVVKPPRGAKRAWQTAALTRKTEVVLGERQATFVDKDGNTHDKHRFVERADGTLEAYEEGVGLPGTKPWGIARPIEP